MGAPEGETWLPRGHLLGGRYRIEGPIGAGGFGQVYRAAQLPLERPVAVKVLPEAGLSNPDRRARFEREAKLAQGLNHPNTVRVLDYGVSADGAPFLVMELLRGEPLQSLLERAGGQPPATAAIILRDVLKSLMEAHALGIVHRDIKPANIFLTSHAGEPLVAKLLDFGVAKHFDPTPEAVRPEDFDPGMRSNGSLTLRGRVMGTPRYMAPEQVAGERLGPQTDLYSLGLTIAETIGGQPVFGDDSAMKVCLAHLAPEPVPLPPTVVGSILGPVLVRATAKDPAVRFRSAEEMLAAVEAARAHRDVAPPNPAIGVANALPGQPMLSLGGPSASAPVAFEPTVLTGQIVPRLHLPAPTQTREATAVAVPSPPTVSPAATAPPSRSWLPVVAILIAVGALGGGAVLVWQLASTTPAPPRPKAARSAVTAAPPPSASSGPVATSAAPQARWPFPYASHSFDTPKPRKFVPAAADTLKRAAVELGYTPLSESTSNAAGTSTTMASYKGTDCMLSIVAQQYPDKNELEHGAPRLLVPWEGAVPAYLDDLTVVVLVVSGRTVELAQGCVATLEKRFLVE